MARKNKIETPEQLYQWFSEYKDWVKNNPIEVHNFVGGMAKEVHIRKQRPLTMEGFNVYIRREYQMHSANDYFGNKNNRYRRFSDICHAIKEEIRQDQIEGGMAGIYNPSITQRLNNLVDKVEQTVIEQPLFSDDESDTEEDD
jgi:hypothetical protein